MKRAAVELHRLARAALCLPLLLRGNCPENRFVICLTNFGTLAEQVIVEDEWNKSGPSVTDRRVARIAWIPGRATRSQQRPIR